MKQFEEVKEQTPHEQLAEAREIWLKMEKLFENPEYRFLLAHQQANLDMQTQFVFNPPGGLDGVINQIFSQGHVKGFLDAMNFAKVLHANASETVKQLDYLDQDEEKEEE